MKRISTRSLVVSGLLVALTLVMAATGAGFVPLPTLAGAATAMHVPVIVAGVLEGPVVGILTGAIFGLFTLQFMPDPFVVIPARLLIGVAAYFAFIAFRREWLGAAAAAIAGTLVNTIGTLGLAVALGYYPFATVIPIAIAHGIPEVILATAITVPVVLAVRRALKRSGIAAVG